MWQRHGFDGWLFTSIEPSSDMILAPMTIHLLVHKEENTVLVFIETESEDEDEDVEGREIPQYVLRKSLELQLLISKYLVNQMGKPEVVSQLVDTVLQYDLVVLEIKDIDQTVPYDFLDELNNASGDSWNMSLSPRRATRGRSIFTRAICVLFQYSVSGKLVKVFLQ